MKTSKRFQLKTLVLFIFALGSAFAQAAGVNERFPRPIFTPERTFLLSTFSSASVLRDPEIPFEIIFFERAQQSCQLNGDQVLQQLRTFFRRDSSLWSSLDHVFPQSRQRLTDRQITLVIDDYTDFAGQSPDFTSYFLNIESHPVVGLSCASANKNYWLPSLAHEFTHALFDGTNTESWWEEGIAQNLEEDAGGRQPSLTLKHLKNDFPRLLETRRPLPSKESYAINQLFVRYLKQQFGGWSILQAMSDEHTPACDRSSNFLAKIACRGQNFLESSQASQKNILGADKMTASGLLRYFAVALTLNDKNTNSYGIPSWQGSDLAEKPLLKTLEPGQFIAWKDTTLVSKNPQLELYRILSNGEGQFVILAGNQAQDKTAVQDARQKIKSPQKDFLLLLNTGDQPEAVNWLKGLVRWLQ